MQKQLRWRWNGAGLALALMSTQSDGGQAPMAPQEVAAELKQLKPQNAEQGRKREQLPRPLAAEREFSHQAQTPLYQSNKLSLHTVTPGQRAAARGTGSQQAGAATPDETPTAQALKNPWLPQSSRSVARPLVAAAGEPPESAQHPSEVAPRFEQPGAFTWGGKFILKPELQGYSSSSPLAQVGYTVIPALLIGLIDVPEITRNIFTASLPPRAGKTNRLRVGARVPYVYRSHYAVSRKIFTSTATERVYDTSGKGGGAAGLADRYLLNDGCPETAYNIRRQRLKSRTGRDAFEVVSDCHQRYMGTTVTSIGLPLDLPTGSGFYLLQSSRTWLFRYDRASFIGGIRPSAIVGPNFSAGESHNDKASVRLCYTDDTVGRTKQNDATAQELVRIHLTTLLVAYSYRLSDKRNINIPLGAGRPRDARDVSLSIRTPTISKWACRPSLQVASPNVRAAAFPTAQGGTDDDVGPHTLP